MLQESNRVEFKTTLNDKLEKEIVAFLNNHEGGVIYIGIDDAGHSVENPDMDSMQLKIADRIKNNILPSAVFQKDTCNITKCFVSPTGSYFCTTENLLSGAWTGIE